MPELADTSILLFFNIKTREKVYTYNHVFHKKEQEKDIPVILLSLFFVFFFHILCVTVQRTRIITLILSNRQVLIQTIPDEGQISTILNLPLYLMYQKNDRGCTFEMVKYFHLWYTVNNYYSIPNILLLEKNTMPQKEKR